MAYHTRPFRITYSNIFFILAVFTLVFLFVNNYKLVDVVYEDDISQKSLLLHGSSVLDKFYERRMSWNTSKLGSVLFKNEIYPVISEERINKTFVILIWKRWEFLQKRHIYYFGSTELIQCMSGVRTHSRHDPFEECSVRNCIFTGEDSHLDTADAVMVHLHTALIPETESRNPRQKWIFLDDESPKNSFAMARKKPKLSELANVFNWSMTYRSDADIPVPYGRTVALDAPMLSETEPISEIVPNWKIKRRDVLATILISNCGVSYRMDLIKRLKHLTEVHVHGKCGDKELQNSCPGHFRADCKVMSEYLFYFTLENSKCKEYITEKLFYHAYSKGAIPVIQGPSVEDCERLLPPNSYLHFDNYETLEDLVKDLISISESDEKLLSFHMWRNNFEVLNEHGYFGSKSFHLCRLCEAMNYNDMKTSVYSEEDLKKFLDVESLCRKR